MTDLTTAELINLIHMRTRPHMPLATDVCPRENVVDYTIGFRRYRAFRTLAVLEIVGHTCCSSEHAKRQEVLLRGGKRDDEGTLVVEDGQRANNTDSETLVAALRILARDIQSEDGVANACIAEAADRIEELEDRIAVALL